MSKFGAKMEALGLGAVDVSKVIDSKTAPPSAKAGVADAPLPRVSSS